MLCGVERRAHCAACSSTMLGARMYRAGDPCPVGTQDMAAGMSDSRGPDNMLGCLQTALESWLRSAPRQNAAPAMHACPHSVRNLLWFDLKFILAQDAPVRKAQGCTPQDPCLPYSLCSTHQDGR